ncbi:MAG: hypothetical protein HYS62_00505 [Candidatus Aenigmarchaeota archaeon]|nr:hypothetical protein [Candidatus Aenigmarchaeota archaeon]
MKTRLAVALLVSLALMVNATYAVTFSVSLFPSSIEIGQNKLLNFTVTDTGAVNITQLNITLPPGFNFTGTSNTNITSPFTSLTTKPSWTNTSAVGIVGAGQSANFTIYVDTATTAGSHPFNVTTLDANNVFSSNNVSVTLTDTTSPAYSSNTTSPSTNSTYAPNQTYWFNVTWTDNVAISTVQIEHNFTGGASPHNETMNASNSVYYWNFTDLSAGIYVWRVYANDSSNNGNGTAQQNYAIGKATPTVSVFLNGRLNADITSTVNENVNATVSTSCLQSGCTITVKRDNSPIVSGVSSPSYNLDNITSIGLHNYSGIVESNANYTSVTETYFVATLPTYTTSTINIPLTYSNVTVGSINITFGSSPSLPTIYIQGGWSGTASNYTMSNTTATSYYYNITFPAETSYWKIYAIYANRTFNLTNSNSFSINKAAATIVLSISPQWTLDSPVQTNVSCTQSVPALTAKLYRNGTSVSIPDVQTFSAGSIYEYLCNTTANQNYTTDTVKNHLIIKAKPSASISFTEAPTLVEVTQNSTATSQVKIKNIGNVAQNVTLDILNIDKTWYSVDKPSIYILVGQTATFTLTFNVGNVDVKDYPGKLNATGANSTISQDVTLRVLPSIETKAKINDTIALYKLDVDKLDDEVTKLKSATNNTAAVEQKLNELKSKLKQAEDYVNANEYFQAQQTFETIKALISEVESQLEAAAQIPEEVKLTSNTWLMVGGIALVFVIGVLAYLFWPSKKGYSPQRGYAYGGGEEKKSLVNTLKNFLSKFKRKKKIETVLQEGR